MTQRRFHGLAGPFAVLVALQIALGWIVASLFLSSRHSLADNGNWVSTKTTLAEGVLGAYSFVYDLQTLASGALDLGAWHGYQEVVTREELDPVEIEFDFTLDRHGYLVFELNRAGGEFTGVRFSASESFPSAVVTVLPDGEFSRKEPIRKLRRVRHKTRHTARVELGENRFVVYLDGRRLGRFEMPVHRPQRLGFRSGRSQVLVDDLRVVSRDGSVFLEDFEWSGRRPRLAAALAAGLVALTVVLFLLFTRLFGRGERRVAFYLLMFSAVLVVVATIVYAFTSYKSRLYPDRDRFLEAQQEYWKDNETERIFARIESDYPKRPAAGTHRILFVGGSQTRGSGAARDDETLVRQTERLLSQRSPRPVECINTAIHGYDTGDMGNALHDRWLDWNPHTVVINAGNNDLPYGTAAFERHLSAIVSLAHEHGARVILVMEPNSTERRAVRLPDFHQVMSEVAARQGAAAVDMHAYLLDRYDDGFLWWDWVHLTSYGQRLFAERLAAEILALGWLEEDPPAEG